MVWSNYCRGDSASQVLSELATIVWTFLWQLDIFNNQHIYICIYVYCLKEKNIHIINWKVSDQFPWPVLSHFFLTFFLRISTCPVLWFASIFEQFSADNFETSWAEFLWKVESAFWHQPAQRSQIKINYSTPSSDFQTIMQTVPLGSNPQPPH